MILLLCVFSGLKCLMGRYLPRSTLALQNLPLVSAPLLFTPHFTSLLSMFPSYLDADTHLVRVARLWTRRIRILLCASTTGQRRGDAQIILRKSSARGVRRRKSCRCIGGLHRPSRRFIRTSAYWRKTAGWTLSRGRCTTELPTQRGRLSLGIGVVCACSRFSFWTFSTSHKIR